MVKYFCSAKVISAFLFFLFCLLLFASYKDIIFAYPSYIHAWAQADRYALALCFMDNGFDFFHPCTFNYNLQFPAHVPLLAEKGITAVDFPLIEYIIALIMKLCGSTSPVIFRTVIVSISLTGLFFLYRLCKILTRSILPSLAICLFVFLSPVFNYYQIGFIPSIPSLTCLFIAFYFYIKHLETDAYKFFITSILFFTLSALFRFPFIIFLIALSIFHTWQLFRGDKFSWKKILVIGLAFLCIGSYFAYNAHLRFVYGSIFLGSPLPAHSWDEFTYLFALAKQYWGLQYFTHYQYVFMLVIVLLFVCTLLFKKPDPLISKGLQILMIACLGCSMYALLMMQQFPDHDYYFLDTGFPVCILFLVFMYATIYRNVAIEWVKHIISFALLLILFFSYKDFKQVLDQRYAKGQWCQSELNDRLYFEHSDLFLDSIGVSKSAKMLVIGPNTTNMPFILMKRKGYCLLDTKPDSIKKWLSKNIDYVILMNDGKYAVVQQDSTIINQLSEINNNGFFTIYKKSSSDVTDIKKFIGFSEQNIFKKFMYSFEYKMNEGCMRNFGDSSAISFSKPYGGRQTEMYGLTVELTQKDFPVTDVLQLVYAEIWLHGTEDNQNVELVVQAKNAADESIYYKTFPLHECIRKNEWNKAAFVFSVPPMTHGNRLTVFISNPDQKEFTYDNFSLYIKK